MFNIGDKVIVITSSLFQKKFNNQVGKITNIKFGEKYCYNIAFRDNSIDQEGKFMWWTNEDVLSIEMTDDEYNNMNDPKGASIKNANITPLSDQKKYGLNFVLYTKVIAYIEIVISIIYALYNWVSSSNYTPYNDNVLSVGLPSSYKSTLGTYSFFGGIITFVLLMLFASMAENLAYIRKNTEKDL